MRVTLVLICGLIAIASVRAETIDEELSRRSGVAVRDLGFMLEDCNGAQSSQTLCALKMLIEAEHRLAANIAALPPSCAARAREALPEWQRHRDDRCVQEADDEAAGGSMWRAVLYICVMGETSAHASVVARDCVDARPGAQPRVAPPEGRTPHA